MSHEQTITTEIDGKYYNVPTVINGKKRSDKEAIDYHVKNQSLGAAFDSLDEAVTAAEKRSRSFKTLVD
jgi:hypothetical protein